MKGKTLKKFKEYYAQNLKKEVERFQMPLPSIVYNKNSILNILGRRISKNCYEES